VIASNVAKRYAKALFELARESGQVDPLGRALASVARALETSADLRSVIENPKYLPETKKQVVRALAERVLAPPMLISALMMLADRRRLAHLRSISDAYQSMAEEAAGRLRAEVISATALPDAYYRELEKALSEATGRQVTLVRRQDPSLIGGVVAKVGDTVYDGSIKNRLASLRQQMLTAAQNPQGRS
jgi:F-type H+-transporting ATPase subunit delta